MKRLFSLFLVLTMLVCSFPQSVQANNNSTINRIDNLYLERAELARNYEINKVRINEIDIELESLGVQEISEAEVKSKLTEGNEVTPLVVLPTSSTVKWTSYRQQTSYRGQMYDMQIIRAVPKAVNSGLYKSLALVDHQPSSAISTGLELMEVAATTAVGSYPQIGTPTVVFYDVFKTLISGLSTNTVINGVSANYTTGITANYLFVWVKQVGQVDDGNQLLSYKGNYVTVDTNVAIPGMIEVNGNMVANVPSGHIYQTITSPYYNSGYMDRACNVYWEHINNNNVINEYFHTQRITLNYITKTKSVTAPEP